MRVNTYPHKNDVNKRFKNLLLTKSEKQHKNQTKYFIYRQFNPELKAIVTTAHRNFTRLRLGSHSMPIETGRCSQIKNRLCPTCKVLGDERHYIYDCCEIGRNNLENIPALDKLANKKPHFLIETLEPYLI